MILALIVALAFAAVADVKRRDHDMHLVLEVGLTIANIYCSCMATLPIKVESLGLHLLLLTICRDADSAITEDDVTTTYSDFVSLCNCFDCFDFVNVMSA